jgi:anaerobic selenocysteine-containing dehydrogenase
VKLKLKPGDTVRVVGERGTAKIRAILTSMHGALLEKQNDGFRTWNLDELRLVKRNELKRRNKKP